MKFGERWAIFAVGVITVFAFPTICLSDGYKEVAVANGGSIKGKVTYEGALPVGALQQRPVVVNRNKCGYRPRPLLWVNVKDGALRGTFVFIDKIEEGKKWLQPEGGNYLIDQKDCYFLPRFQVVRAGSTLTVKNSDYGVAHNINTRELIGMEKKRIAGMEEKRIARRTMFNIGQLHLGEIEVQVRPRRSPFVVFTCEIHSFMVGFLMATKHPYAVLVKEDGSYAIDDVPPGKYTVKAWHPRLGLKKTKLTVPAAGEAEANFVFSDKDEFLLTDMFIVPEEEWEKQRRFDAQMSR